MSAPAIFALLVPKNLRVLEDFVRRYPGTTVLSPACAVTADARERIAAAGGRLVALETLLDGAAHEALAGEVKRRSQGLAGELSTPAWKRRWQKTGIPAAALAECLTDEAAERLPGLLGLVAALQQAAAVYSISLVLVNDDLTSVSRVVVQWARRCGIPSLQLSHSLLLCEPYTVHARTHADVTAVFGERGVQAYKDVGVDPARLRVTGNPAWDEYAQLGRYRTELRATMAALHGLSPAVPIVVFGTTWSANLTALGDEGLYGKTLRAFLVACKELHDQGVALQPVVKDRPSRESSPQRVHELAAELGLPPDFVRFSMADAMSWVLTADVLISVQSNLSVEAMLAGVAAINLFTELGMALGPCFAADSGVLEVEERELARALRELLLNDKLRAQQLELQSRAVAHHNAGVDGKATERVVALMAELALPERLAAPRSAADDKLPSTTSAGRADRRVPYTLYAVRRLFSFVRARYLLRTERRAETAAP